ncbi:DUF1800 domain-containing protein [Caulobacter soli]|uniref:DUF1800 domain-containing protein n=1 Tax=Caulobacter soli TaxID=2708539 RepID=UPI001FE8880A|nr:DUF1800 family protein [Caulobacter soli]
MSLPSNDMMAAIAATRFGLGARPDEIDAARSDPRGFLTAQIRPEGADQPQGVESSAERLAQAREFQMQRQAAAKVDGDPKAAPVKAELAKNARNAMRDQTGDDFLARAQLGATTDAAFRERWALFWANHFTVSSSRQNVGPLIGPFEQEAIRAHAFGRFEDMLVASSTHPAMLLYLDQAQSVGPNSKVSIYQRTHAQKVGGLNENLAREILELHTVGVNAGYSQADVTEFARAMTGFSVGQEPNTSFRFRDNAHEPGVHTVMGRRYSQEGQAQALAVMRDLAASPHTAHHVSTKLAAHFVSDTPPPTLVARLEKSYLDSGGRLDELARTLVQSPEAWDPTPTKFKTPYEFAISTWRAMGAQSAPIGKLPSMVTNLGQKPFSPPSPKGWDDTAQVWCAPDALIQRLRFSQGLAALSADGVDPNVFAQSALGARLTPPVAKAVARAETRREAMALLLMSPEFQRR